MSKKTKITIAIIILVIILIILMQIVYKNIKNGNNIIKSTDDLIEYILNISSYESKAEVTINSNKTTNKYLIEQYYMKPEYFKQIVRKPESIKDLEMIYSNEKLEIRNTNLGLNKIYQNYSYINSNMLWLNFFIENCENDYEINEESEEVIISSFIKKYNYKGKLYINKKEAIPTKLEIIDNSNKTKIYIEYKEIKLNNIQKDNIFAFITKDIKKGV